MISNHSEGTFGRLRYSLGGDRPSQTAHLTLSPHRIHGTRLELQIRSGWYPNVASTQAGAPASQAPTYPVQIVPKFNIKLQ